MALDPLDLHLTMPDWAAAHQATLPEFVPDLEQRMRIVLQLADLNIERNTGGPFAAGVFEQASGRLIALGVNRVVASGCSSAHAEVMALGRAQKRLGTYDLGGPGLPAHELVVNWRPCAMCYGALLWSGVRALIIAGSGPELEDLTGFDEGPVHPHWKEELAARGITTREDVLRAEAVAQFRRFRDSARPVYNARQGGR